jgi:hypothetical protein
MSDSKIGRRFLAAAGLVASLSAVPLFGGNESRLRQIPRSALCVTEGALEESSGQGFSADLRLSVNVPKMRAYVNHFTTQTVALNFAYLGPTATESALGSGEIRRQLGLKLRAQDPCNLVYAMWRFEPESGIVVSVKSNPGQRTSPECANRGYRNIKPRRSAPAPLLHPGDTHTLRAEMDADFLRVFADGAVVWEGQLGAEVSNLNGPVGIRSDNVRLRLGLEAGEPAGVHPEYVVACTSGPSESE